MLYWRRLAEGMRVRRYFRPLVIMQLGITVVSSIILSLVAGIWIDGQLGTSPWATLLGMLLGTLSAFYAVYRLIARLFGDIDKERGE